ncbi:TIGR04028 family ABC transporter substrate-binding protein [Paenochrobactrum pullorum]|uniref:TIGR04028 family ABC transporter substrate-binding protein n=1 Tax=Paenochrobactrum pullorum TaxID=1324351 RepID=UPI0035BC8223
MSKFKRRHFLQAAVAIYAITAINLNTVSSYAQEETAAGGTLIYLEKQPHTSLYPPAAGFYPNGGVLNQITDKLTYQNPRTLEIEPWLAESWEINSDATEYTFHLRDGITFSDGSPVDAKAIAANFDVYGLGNIDRKQTISEAISNYERSEVVDAKAVKFYFKASSPGFLQATATPTSGIVSPATPALSADEFGQAPNIIGSGPFVVASEKLGTEIRLAARKDYNWAPVKLSHQGRAKLDGITILTVPEDGVRIGSLLSQQGDFIRQVHSYDEAQVKAAGYTVYGAQTRGTTHAVAFRPSNALVADRQVRQALLHATNSQEIIDTLFTENYPKARSPLSSVSEGFIDLSSELVFDPDLAKKLLDEAGWKTGADGIREKEGKRLSLGVYDSLNYARSKETLQLLAQQWQNVGVELKLLAGEAGTRTKDDLNPEVTPLVPTKVERADPEVLKSQYYPTTRDQLRQQGGKGLGTEFVDAKLNAILDAIASEPNTAKRLDHTQDAQKYLIEQAYVIPLFEEPQSFAGAPYVKDIDFDAVGRPLFYSVSLDRK